MQQAHAALAGYLEHFRARVLQDALNEATASYWLRRAEAYAAAQPRADDWIGVDSSPAERAERRRRLQEAATACRAKAAICLRQDVPSTEVWAALAESATQSHPARPAA